MTHLSTITSLLEFSKPLHELRTQLSGPEWDAKPVATLSPRHIAAVLRRFQAGELDAAAVEEWANLVECREDIEFDPRRAADIADAIHDIANPELQGHLADTVDDLLDILAG